MTASGALLESTMTPLNRADHAARLAAGSGLSAATLTESWPCVALSLNAVVNKSNRSQSFFGAVFAASNGFTLPVRSIQMLVPVRPLAVRTSDALRYTVCHGVPRWTRPSQPTVGNLFVGKFQSSEL